MRQRGGVIYLPGGGRGCRRTARGAHSRGDTASCSGRDCAEESLVHDGWRLSDERCVCLGARAIACWAGSDAMRQGPVKVRLHVDHAVIVSGRPGELDFLSLPDFAHPDHCRSLAPFLLCCRFVESRSCLLSSFTARKHSPSTSPLEILQRLPGGAENDGQEGQGPRPRWQEAEGQEQRQCTEHTSS